MEVITFGETMVLFNPDQMLPLEYVHQFGKSIAGAESNVAIGLQRLGHSVGWFGKLGNDPFGRFIHQFIRGQGVDTSHCIFSHEAPTGIMFKDKRTPATIQVFYYRKNSAASLLHPDELDETYIGQAKILHLTGITPALSPSCKETIFRAIEIARSNGLQVVFDPNIRLKLWSKEEAKPVLREIAALADYVLPGLEEGKLLTGQKTPEDIAAALLDNGAKTVVVKLGKDGAYYQNRSSSGYVKGFPVANEVDPIGAGDAFAAGLISGILLEEALEMAVRRANAVGAIVVGVNGDVEGLPTREEVDQLLSDELGNEDVIR